MIDKSGSFYIGPGYGNRRRRYTLIFRKYIRPLRGLATLSYYPLTRPVKLLRKLRSIRF